jgi:hypothetical protein
MVIWKGGKEGIQNKYKAMVNEARESVRKGYEKS